MQNFPIHPSASSTHWLLLLSNVFFRLTPKVLFLKCKAYHDSRLIATLQWLPISLQYSQLLTSQDFKKISFLLSFGYAQQPLLSLKWQIPPYSEDRVPCVLRRVLLPCALSKQWGCIMLKTLNKIYCLPSVSGISFQRHIMVKNNYPREKIHALRESFFMMGPCCHL